MTNPGRRDHRGAALALGVALALTGFVSVAQPGDQPQAGGAPVVNNGATVSAPTAVPAESPQTRRMLDLLNRMDQLENEVRRLRGDLEVLNHDVQGLKDRQRELYLDVDRRLRELELSAGHGAGGGASPTPAASATGPASGGAVSTGGSPAGGAAPGALPPAQQRSAYQAAFNLLKDGQYPQAISAFEAFLKQYPDSEYAGNAQYWLGEANYVSRNFKQALVEFDRVLTKYASSPKVPDATLKMGYTYYELGQWAKARATLQKVIKSFPGSSAQRLAQTRLQRMRKEGH
jgi:tol-pal system protein YbgF